MRDARRGGHRVMAADDGTGSILVRLKATERRSLVRRRGEITDTDPLSVVLGGADTTDAYVGVKALADCGRLEVGDVVECLYAQNDVLIIGRAADGGGFQSAGPSGSDTGITSATVTALTSGPSLTVREAGAYAITFGMTMVLTGAGGVGGMVGALLIGGVAQGGATLTQDRLYLATGQNGGATVEKTIIRTLAAGDVLTIGRASPNSVAAAFAEAYISIRPAR